MAKERELKSFKDDKFTIKADDLDGIRLRPTETIGNLGSLGVLHLCKEIVDNNRDECFKKASPGNTINIIITDDYIISSDNGRGIPTDLIRTIHETRNAGSNMTRDGGSTAGENGVGTAAYAALASKLVVTTIRPQEKKKYTVVYKEGKFFEDHMEDYDGKEHGMITKFYPSKKILGVDKIPIPELVEWLDMFNYTLPADIKMNYVVNGEENHVTYHELVDYINKTIGPDNLMCVPLTFDCEGEIVEDVQYKTYHRTLKAEICISYASPDYKEENVKKSWMNMIYTPLDGTHMKGALDGITRYLCERVYKKKKALEDEDIRKDVLAHLQILVKCECDMANMFSAQAKNNVYAKEIQTTLAAAVYEKLCSLNYSKTDDFVDIVIANNRVRREGEKARAISSSTKVRSKWEKPDNYIPCSNVKTKEGKELFLVEGRSAGGGIRAARDARFQAIMQFRGKNFNTWDATLEETLKFGPWNDLVKVAECGIGPTFDPKKCKFDKFIITSDADIDGYHIRVGFCIFFLKWWRELIMEGRLYIAEPPLYKLAFNNDKKSAVYVSSKKEYIEECLNTIEDIELEFVG